METKSSYSSRQLADIKSSECDVCNEELQARAFLMALHIQTLTYSAGFQAQTSMLGYFGYPNLCPDHPIWLLRLDRWDSQPFHLEKRIALQNPAYPKKENPEVLPRNRACCFIITPGQFLMNLALLWVASCKGSIWASHHQRQISEFWGMSCSPEYPMHWTHHGPCRAKSQSCLF